MQHKKKPICENCLELPAAIYCKNDQAMLCSKCDKELHQSVITKRHERIPICDVQQTTKQSGTANNGNESPENIQKSSSLSAGHVKSISEIGSVNVQNTQTAPTSPNQLKEMPAEEIVTNDSKRRNSVNTKRDSRMKDSAAMQREDSKTFSQLIADLQANDIGEELLGDFDTSFEVPTMNVATRKSAPSREAQRQQQAPSDSFNSHYQQTQDPPQSRTVSIHAQPTLPPRPPPDETGESAPSATPTPPDVSKNGSMTASFTNVLISKPQVSNFTSMMGDVADTITNLNDTLSFRSEGMCADRKARVERYRAKRKLRSFTKVIRYASRKAYAEVRPRIKGRFVKREHLESYLQLTPLEDAAPADEQPPQEQQQLQQQTPVSLPPASHHVPASMLLPPNYNLSMFQGFPMYGSGGMPLLPPLPPPGTGLPPMMPPPPPPPMCQFGLGGGGDGLPGGCSIQQAMAGQGPSQQQLQQQQQQQQQYGMQMQQYMQSMQQHQQMWQQQQQQQQHQQQPQEQQQQQQQQQNWHEMYSQHFNAAAAASMSGVMPNNNNNNNNNMQAPSAPPTAPQASAYQQSHQHQQQQPDSSFQPGSGHDWEAGTRGHAGYMNMMSAGVQGVQAGINLDGGSSGLGFGGAVSKDEPQSSSFMFGSQLIKDFSEGQELTAQN